MQISRMHKKVHRGSQNTSHALWGEKIKESMRHQESRKVLLVASLYLSKHLERNLLYLPGHKSARNYLSGRLDSIGS